MQLKILGAGAGGGLPQWNCGCRNCADARAGQLPPMTQSSAAVSLDGRDWVVLNASPDIRAQLAATPALHPRSLRGSPIVAVVLTNGDVDHIAGLLTLRERTPFTLFATAEVFAILDDNDVFRVLDPDLVARRTIAPGDPFEVAGLRIAALPVPGKVALFREGPVVDTRALGGQTVALRIEGGGRRVFYVPGCADLPDPLAAALIDADLLLFDGTVWADDDMPRSGTGAKTGARMGHLAMDGPQGSLARLSGGRARRVFTHVNNTNPVLQPGSPQRAAVAAAGWDIASDGMEIVL